MIVGDHNANRQVVPAFLRSNWSYQQIIISTPLLYHCWRQEEREACREGVTHFFAASKGPGHPQGECPYYTWLSSCIVGAFPLRVPWLCKTLGRIQARKQGESDTQGQKMVQCLRGVKQIMRSDVHALSHRY